MNIKAEFNKDSEEYICPRNYMNGDEIFCYAFSLAKVQFFQELDDYILSKLQKFGKDFKSIQKDISEHIEQCYPCKEEFDSAYETEVFNFNLARTLKQKVLEFEIGDVEAYNATVSIEQEIKLRKQFISSHLTKMSDINLINSLQEYIFKKALASARAKKLAKKGDLEKHIGNCDFCTHYYKVQEDNMKNMIVWIEKIK